MRLKNDASGIDELFNYIYEYYSSRGRDFHYLSSGSVGRSGDEGDHYFVSFLLDKKYILKYSMPTAIRTVAGLWVGVGPEYVSIEWLIDRSLSKNFSKDNTTEAIDSNLKLFDEYKHYLN